jgi:hypothetical protein
MPTPRAEVRSEGTFGGKQAGEAGRCSSKTLNGREILASAIRAESTKPSAALKRAMLLFSAPSALFATLFALLCNRVSTNPFIFRRSRTL